MEADPVLDLRSVFGVRARVTASATETGGEYVEMDCTADPGSFQDHLEGLDRLVRAGKVRGRNDPRPVIYTCMSAARHRPDVTVRPPQWLVEAMASIGRRLGFSLEGPSR